MPFRPLIAVLALAVLLAACSAADPRRGVDGWEVGAQVACATREQGFCDQFLGVAAKAFDDSEPGHLPIVELRLYEPATLAVRSGGPVYVAVFTLADGSLRALGVGNLGISGPVPFDAPDRPRFPGGAAPPTTKAD